MNPLFRNVVIFIDKINNIMNEKWTYEKCKEIALRFKTRRELKNNFYQVHHKIYRKKWHELLSHMERESSKRDRCVYYYRFNDGWVYVGITCDYKRRDRQHRENGPVYEHSVEINEPVPQMDLLTDYIDFRDAASIEIEVIEELKKSNKVKLLNRERGGGLGNWVMRHVTKDECIEDIKKCNNKTELRNKYYSSYVFLRDHLGEMEEVFQNFFLSDKTHTKVVSFDSNGDFYKIFDKMRDAEKECGSKQISEACHEHYYTNGYYFIEYDEWVNKGKPLKVISRKEKNKIGNNNTIKKRNERYAKFGNPQTGTKRSIECRKKLSTPLVMTDKDGNFVDAVWGLSFAVEKYNLPNKISKWAHKVINNSQKSMCGYRWYKLDFYNKTFNKNIELCE